MSTEHRTAAARRRARASWPIVRHRLDEDGGDDISAHSTALERMAMMTELAEAAWLVSGRELPTYTRSEMPGRIFRNGEPVPEDDW